MRPLRRGTNLSRVSGFNEAVVIDAIRRAEGGISRVEVSNQTGLSAQTVSNIVRRMLESGLLSEGTPIAAGTGKPRTPLVLNPNGRFAIGVHLDPLKSTVVLANLRGQILSRKQWPTVVDQPPETTMDEISAIISELLNRAEVSTELVAGIGWACPGPIDHRNGLVVNPPHLPTWRNIAVIEEMSQRTGLPVELDKDVVAALVGERWAGAAIGQANVAFLYLGTGIGLGFAVDDAMVRGGTGNAGDIGHLVIDDRGPLCNCGMRGCIGVTLNPASLIQQAVIEGALNPDAIDILRSGDPSRIDQAFKAFGDQVDRESAEAVRVIETSARQLAKAITTVADLLDADAVVVGGPTWTVLRNAYTKLLPTLVANRLIRHSLGKELQVISSRLGDDVIAVGAACLVLDNAFAPALSSIALQP